MGSLSLGSITSSVWPPPHYSGSAAAAEIRAIVAASSVSLPAVPPVSVSVSQSGDPAYCCSRHRGKRGLVD